MMDGVWQSCESSVEIDCQNLCLVVALEPSHDGTLLRPASPIQSAAIQLHPFTAFVAFQITENNPPAVNLQL